MLNLPKYQMPEVFPQKKDKKVSFLSMFKKDFSREWSNYKHQFNRYLMSQVGSSWDRVCLNVSRLYPDFKVHLKHMVSQNPLDENTDKNGSPICGFYVWDGKLCHKQGEK